MNTSPVLLLRIAHWILCCAFCFTDVTHSCVFSKLHRASVFTPQSPCSSLGLLRANCTLLPPQDFSGVQHDGWGRLFLSVERSGDLRQKATWGCCLSGSHHEICRLQTVLEFLHSPNLGLRRVTFYVAPFYDAVNGPWSSERKSNIKNERLGKGRNVFMERNQELFFVFLFIY